jgi:hypothetical protein
MSRYDAKECQCIPTDLVPPELHRKLMTDVKEILLHRALVRRVISSVTEGAIRDARPEDFGLATLGWRTPALRKDGFTGYISHTLLWHQVACLYGVAQEDPEPAICQVKVGVGERCGEVYNIINLQRAYAHVVITEAGVHRKEVLLVNPIWFDPGQHVRIDVGSRADKPDGDQLIPLFMVLEPRGAVVL